MACATQLLLRRATRDPQRSTCSVTWSSWTNYALSCARLDEEKARGPSHSTPNVKSHSLTRRDGGLAL
eukprot:scaffold135241_cov28-Tisochrysis_lutea.AAC.1